MHGRLQKKRKILFLLFLFFVLSFYIERRYFLEKFKTYLEKEISRQVPFLLRIEEFEKIWGKRMVLKNVSISEKENNFLILAEEVYLELNIFDLLFKKYKKLDYIEGEAENVDFFIKGVKLPVKISYLNFFLDNGYLEIKDLKGLFFKKIPFQLELILGKLTDEVPKIELKGRLLKAPERKIFSFFIPAVIFLSGDLQKFSIEGFNNLDKPLVHWEGEFYPQKGSFDLVISSIERKFTPIKVKANFKEETKSLKVIFDHFFFQDNELISNLNIKLKYNHRGKILEGEVYSSGSLLNYFPLPEAEAKFKIKDGYFDLEEFKWMDFLSIVGEASFLEKISGNFNINVNNFNLFYLAHLFYPKWSAWGSVSGKFNLEIKEEKVLSNGELELSDGEFGPFKFKGGKIRFTGEDNILKIADSRIYENKGYFDIKGEIDLQRLGKPDLGKTLVLIPYQERWDLQGWSISKKDFMETISVDKEIDEKFSIQFRSYIGDSKDSVREREGEVGLEYKIKEDRSLKLRLKEDEEILGFERRIKF